MAVIGEADPPKWEDLHRAYKDDSEQQMYLWRKEVYDRYGSLHGAKVHGGKTGTLWSYEKHNPETTAG